MYTVYRHTNVINNKAYIGLTSLHIDERWKQHVSDSTHGSKTIFHHAIRKYDISVWKHEILKVCETLNEAKVTEIQMIAEHGTFFLEHGYNMTRGGDGIIGRVYTDEQRKRISESNSKRHLSPETREKIRKARLGKKRSTPISDKERTAMRDAKLGERNPNAKLTLEKVNMIRQMFKMGTTNAELATLFSVTRSTISNVIHNKVWKI